MNYKEDLLFDKEYIAFLLKYCKKKEIRFQYYTLGKNRKHDCCFIGYSTNGGIHGLHYDRTIHTYYFGHRNPSLDFRPFELHYRLVIKMPSIYRDAFLYATNNKKSLLIRNNKIIDPKSGDLVSG